MEENYNWFSEESKSNILFDEPYEIYIVDDNERQLEETGRILKEFVYKNRAVKITTFLNAKDTINALEEDDPIDPKVAVIYLDIVMEDSGFEVIKFLRNERKNRITQIIVQTAQAGLSIETPDKIAAKYEIADIIIKGVKSDTMRILTSVNTGLRSYELLKKLYTANKKLHIIYSSLQNYCSIIKENKIPSDNEKELLIQLLVDQLNKTGQYDKKQIAKDAIERLIEHESANIVYLYTVIERAVKSTKGDTITKKDIARVESMPALKWKATELLLQRLYYALCGNKIGKMNTRPRKWIDPKTEYVVFRSHHHQIISHTHITWVQDIKSLLYLYFTLIEKVPDTGYLEGDGVWENIHNELLLHYKMKNEDLLNQRSLISTRSDYFKKVAVLNNNIPIVKGCDIEYTMEYAWRGKKNNKEEEEMKNCIDDIVDNIEEIYDDEELNEMLMEKYGG
jgi:CheY-like chemotaxis protein